MSVLKEIKLGLFCILFFISLGEMIYKNFFILVDN